MKRLRKKHYSEDEYVHKRMTEKKPVTHYIRNKKKKEVQDVHQKYPNTKMSYAFALCICVICVMPLLWHREHTFMTSSHRRNVGVGSYIYTIFKY